MIGFRFFRSQRCICLHVVDDKPTFFLHRNIFNVRFHGVRHERAFGKMKIEMIVLLMKTIKVTGGRFLIQIIIREFGIYKLQIRNKELNALTEI